ncbi:MAG: hypothetical protein P8H56_05215 [Crocinitomicaceae bacterium]|nr:hypothetical protein [Crocinitomicaceae bacterium]MDG1657963.1 hypothetical protein [Crocinitomicaceae bacterium]
MKSVLVLIVILLSNLSNAQDFFPFNRTTKKDLLEKIDSLEGVIELGEMREESNYLLFDDSTDKLVQIINDLNYQLDSANAQLESLQKTIEEFELQSQTSDDSLCLDSRGTFCPAPKMLSEVELLKDCCCLRDEDCERELSPEGLEIVRTGYEMTVTTKQLIKGSCWDFINTVYNNAGFSSSSRETIFKGKKGSDQIDVSLLQPGDWIYHINYSFQNVEHSAIFICWKDYDKKLAITLSHVGQNKSRAGQFGVYDLRSVYNVMRPLYAE